MLLETRINGFTAWANFRLQIVDHDLMKNIITDIMEGYNMKILVESMTGRPFRKLMTFNGLSLTQKETRFKWIVDELKFCGIINQTFNVDLRLLASKVASELFKLFWEMVSYDLQFLWLRSEFLQQKDYGKLANHPIRYIPSTPLVDRQSSNLLDDLMFKSSLEENKLTSRETAIKRDRQIICEGKLKNIYPPIECLFKLLNNHLKMTRAGKKLSKLENFVDLIDSRVLCALVNSMVPDTITSEVLLNDRWSVNLSLQIMMEMSRCTSSFYAEDLVHADYMAVGSYFSFFFMSGYSLCQARAVVSRVDAMKLEIMKKKEHLMKFPTVIHKKEILERKKSLENTLTDHKDELTKLESNYQIEECRTWMKEIKHCQEKIIGIVSDAMNRKYEVLTVSTNCTLNEFASFMMINLSLTSSFGYFECTSKEHLTLERNIIIQDKATGRFYDSSGVYNGKKCPTARKLMRVSAHENFELNPSKYPKYTIFLEALSSNKLLKAGSLYIYQIFNGDFSGAQNLLFKAIREKELNTVQNLVSFFRTDPTFLNGYYGDSKITPLHSACKYGHFKIALYLLEQNALINTPNGCGNTPFFLAVENGQRDVCKLLIEWGADIHLRNKAGTSVISTIRNKSFREFIEQTHRYWDLRRVELLDGNLKSLSNVIQNHVAGKMTLSTLRSRCVSGSTLLHVASYFGDVKSVQELIAAGLNVNVRDNKQATSLHRARSVPVVEVLREYNIDFNATDQDGNTSLHVRCYGECDKQTDVECIKELISRGVDVVAKNAKGLMAIHCAAIQGRHDAIVELMNQDEEGAMTREILNDKTIPSILYLTMANDHLECAQWLKDKGFYFKENEVGILLEKIFMEQQYCKDRQATIKFLYENDVSSTTIFPGNNTALHIAASQLDLHDVVQFCIDQKQDVDALNDDFCTPLHLAVCSNNLKGAALLIQNRASLFIKNRNGLTPFDLIKNYDDWTECVLFEEEIRELIRAYSIKQARHLVRAISNKINRTEMENFMRKIPGDKHK